MPQGPLTADIATQTESGVVSRVALVADPRTSELEVSSVSNSRSAYDLSAANVLKLGAGNLIALNNLVSTNLGLLTTTQIAALTVGTFYDLTSTNVAALTSTQTATLASGGFAALTTTQVTALSSSELLGMSIVTAATIDYHYTPFTNGLVFNPASSGQTATIVFK